MLSSLVFCAMLYFLALGGPTSLGHIVHKDKHKDEDSANTVNITAAVSPWIGHKGGMFLALTEWVSMTSVSNPSESESVATEESVGQWLLTVAYVASADGLTESNAQLIAASRHAYAQLLPASFNVASIISEGANMSSADPRLASATPAMVYSAIEVCAAVADISEAQLRRIDDICEGSAIDLRSLFDLYQREVLLQKDLFKLLSESNAE